MDLKLVYGVFFVAVLYLIYRNIRKPNKELTKEIEKVLNSEEFKVKGQFD